MYDEDEEVPLKLTGTEIRSILVAVIDHSRECGRPTLDPLDYEVLLTKLRHALHWISGTNIN